MLSRVVSTLADPELVSRFQKLCGVEFTPADSDSPADDQLLTTAAVRADIDAISQPGRSSPDHRLHHNNNTHRTTNGNTVNHVHDNHDSSGGKSQGVINGLDTTVRNHHRYANGLDTVVENPHTSVNGVDIGVGQHHHDGQCLVRNGVGSTNHSRHGDISTPSPHLPPPSQTDNLAARENSSPTKAYQRVPVHAETNRRGLNHHANGKTVTQKTVTFRYPVLYYWAKVGATLGNEEFYLTGMPFLLWTVDSCVIRHVAVVWWLVMYVGQASKDYLAWPRPPSPPVVRLETCHLAEFSMPSTHAMAGTAIPLLLATLLLDRYQLPTVPVVCVAFLWCSTTCLSRLYLGVHTVLDVVCGVLLSLALYAFISTLVPIYDHYQQTSIVAPIVLVLASLAICNYCYPSSGNNSAKGDAIVITAVVVGVGIGAWLNFQLSLSVDSPKPFRVPVATPTLGWLGVSILQFIVGVALVLAAKIAVRWLTLRFFSACYGLDSPDTEHPGVMLGYKYTTYLCVGMTMVFVAPLIFTLLGFGRPGYYHEMV